MGSYRWKLNHKCDAEDVHDLLLKFGFEENPEGGYTLSINDWKDLDLEVLNKTTLQATFYWAGAKTTEIYFDYLMYSGYVLGQISCYLDLMARDDFEFPAESGDRD